MRRPVRVALIGALLMLAGCLPSACSAFEWPQPRPPAAVAALIPAAAIDLIVGFEIVSPGYYEQHLQAPICPGHVSGPTVGIGTDLGYQLAAVIRTDWHAHPQRERLVQMAGIKGVAACTAVVRRAADVRTAYPLARTVFEHTTVVRYYRMMRRAYPGAEQLPPSAQGALTSLTINRGPSMLGYSRAEMRTIRDVCVPARDVQCIDAQLRAMTRVWRRSTIERGMIRRRNAEADLLGVPR